MKNRNWKFLKQLVVLKMTLVILLFGFFLKVGVKKIFGQTNTDWINSFNSEIKINEDSSILIKETIFYETTIDKHGIYRYIPVSYKKDGWAYTIRIDQIKVTDEAGKKISFSDYREGKNRVLKMGEADKMFVGEKAYVLEYRVEGGLNRFEEYDELYWDITGEGWKIPIKESRATVVSPFGVIKKIHCFSGIVGEDDGFCKNSFDEKQAVFEYPEIIDYGKNLTVLVGLDKNNLIKWPSEAKKMMHWIKDNFFVFLIPLPMVLMFILWFWGGRDWMFLSANVFNLDENQPKKLKPLFYKHRTAFVYEPLKELTPGEAGLMVDERVDNQDVVAEIIDLARKKYLKIEKKEKKGFFNKKEDYKFIKLKEAGESLPDHQRYLLESIFENRQEVMLSVLKGSFYQKMEKTRKLIYEGSQNKKFFVGNPSFRRMGFLILVLVLSAGSFFFTITGIELSGQTWLMGVFLMQTVLALVLAYSMPQKTAVGTNLMLQAKGLREMIKLGRWREEIKEKNLFIEEVLPFAICLGVVGKLVKDMEGLNVGAPEYFSGAGLTASSFGRMINDFSVQASSGLAYNPSSSSWSGGSGFSGGGSSGGGGGGGGGGSW